MNSLIMGRRRRGKSTLALWLALKKNPNGIIVFDPNCQFKQFQTVSDLDTLEEMVEERKYKILSYQCDAASVDDEFNAVAETLWPYGDFAFIIDESHNLQSPNKINSWLARYIRQAPTDTDPQTIHIIQTLHRPQDVNGVAWSQATHVAIFRTTLARDLEAIEINCGEECMEAVRALKSGSREFVLYDVDGAQHEVITDSSKWFVELRKGEQKNG